jgi:ABC-type transporter Mla subunit MlaD
MDITFLFVALATVAGLGAWGIQVLAGVLQGLQEAFRESHRDELDAIHAQLADVIGDLVALQAKADQLPQTWEEMHAKVRRTEERTRGAVRRARKELEESGFRSEELDGTWAELQPLDADGSGGEGLQPMHNGVGHVPAPVEGPQIEPWRAAALTRKYGR